MFVVKDNKAVFMPIKTGIAGEKYFEVLSGLKEGDQVITGPFASVRAARGGGSGQARDDADAGQAVNQFFEAAVIALGAIWANKLRSFLTVLGNIVAVTSIIAVVSLVQGMNGYVTDRHRLGRRRRQLHDPADAGRPHRRPTRSASATTRASRSRKRRRSGSSATTSARSRRRPQSRATMTLRRASRSTARRCRACRATTSTSATFNAEQRPADQPGRNRYAPAGHGPRLGRRRQAVRAGRSARQDDQDRRPAFPRRRRQREEGVRLRQLAGQLRDHPARRLPEDVRLAACSACSCWSSRGRPSS